MIQHLGVLAYIFLEVIPKDVTSFFLKTLVRVLGFFFPPGVLLACLKITSYFEQEACKYPCKTGFPFYTADLRINVRCKFILNVYPGPREMYLRTIMKLSVQKMSLS